MKSKVSVVILFCFLLMLSLFPFAPSHTSASDETIIEPVPNTWGNIILPDTSVNDSIVFGYDHYTNRSTISAIKFIVPYDVSEAIFEFTTYNGYIDSWLETMILQLGDDNWVAGGFPASYSDGPKVEIEYDELAATEKPGGNEYESTYSINVTELLTPSNIGADREVTFVISGTYPYLPGESIDIYLYNYPPLLPKLKVKYGSMNAAPEIGTIANQSIPEKEFFSLQVPASDENNDELSYSLIDPPSGVQIDSDGLIEWTPTEEQDGVYTIRVQVTDGKADPVEAQFTITVNEVNSAPVLDDIEDQIIDEETLLSFTATAEDEDRVGAGKVPNELAFSLAGSPPAGAAITSAGLFTWTPTEAQGEDSYPITIRVIDQFGGWDEKSFTVTVNETNAPPSIELIVDKEVDELDILSFPVTANDPDPNPNLTYSLVGLDEKTDGAAIDPDTGVFSWTPTEEQDGVHTITVQVSDGTASAQEQFTVTVNEVNVAPELAPIGNKEIDEETLLSFTASATDSDLVGTEKVPNTLTYSIVGIPHTGAEIDSSTGVFTWTPSELYGPGDYNFVIRVADDGGLYDEETIVVKVNEINAPPSLDLIGDKEVDELDTLSFTVTANDPDPDPKPALTYSLVILDEEKSSGATIDKDTGEFSWTPTESQDGTHSFQIIVSDGSLTDEETITVTVNELNATPVLAVIEDQEIGEGEPLDVTATATDSDEKAGVADSLTYSLVTAPTNASINSGTGVITWIPEEDQDGPHVFRVRVSDGSGATAEGEFEVLVHEVNDAPELAVIADQEIEEGESLNVTAIGTDVDEIAGVADSLTYSLVTAPTNASINSGTGVITWTPTESQDGTHVIRVRVSDGSGATAEREFEVLVQEVNVAPELAEIEDQEINEGEPLDVTAAGTDIDMIAGEVDSLTYSLVTAPTNAIINSGTGEITWTPTESQDGTHTFRVRVSDGSGATAEREFEVLVQEVNELPELAVIADQEIEEGESLNVTAIGTDVDVIAGEADSLTYSLVTAPTNASIDTGTGVITWTPGEEEDGTHAFRVRVSDGSGATAEGEFEVLVQEVNVAPELAVIEDQEINEEELFTFIATATDVDVPVNQLTYSLADAPEGASIDADSGEFTWTPTEAQGPGSYTFKVVVSDSTVSVEQEVTLTVREVNTAPVLDEIDDRSLILGDTVKFTAKAYDRDEPSNTLTYSLIDAPEGATINSETGEFTFKPSSDRTYIFKVQASDGELTDEQEVNVKVFPPSPYVPEEILIEVLVNGKVQSIGKATVAVVNGQRVITITVDEQKLDQRLAEEGDNPVITILVNTDDTGVVIGQLSGSMIEKLNNKNAVIVIQTNDSSYSIPAKQLNLSAITSKLGSNVDLKNLNFKIEIAKPLKEMSEAVEKAVKDKGLTLAMEPLSFKITAHYGGKVVEVSSFNVYVERRVTIPAGVDPNRITTAVVIEEDGTIRHVPTQIIKQNNGHEAVINSLTNSTYALIWNPVQFIDVANHWAKDAINNMGSRLIVNGNGTGMYQPDQDITRAEFAAIVVRGLGLRISTSDSSFTDVNASDWYNGAIQTAYEYGLINGFEDGTFRPTESITREQAMLIISKAMKITELQGADSAQATDIVTAFADAAAVSNWAVNGVADSVSAGIITGRNNQWLAPKANITRAEVAMILQRLLQKSELID